LLRYWLTSLLMQRNFTYYAHSQLLVTSACRNYSHYVYKIQQSVFASDGQFHCIDSIASVINKPSADGGRCCLMGFRCNDPESHPMPFSLASAQKIDSNSASTRQALKQYHGRQAGDDGGLHQLANRVKPVWRSPYPVFRTRRGNMLPRVPVILKSQPCRDPRSAGKRRAPVSVQARLSR
jgi:hypothetical protein